jgi:hypothetical protein
MGEALLYPQANKTAPKSRFIRPRSGSWRHLRTSWDQKAKRHGRVRQLAADAQQSSAQMNQNGSSGI